MLLVLWAPSPASAHPGPPAVVDLAFDGERILAGTSFGLLLSEDGGDTWRWICPGAYQGRTTDDQWVSFGDGGALHVGGNDAVGRATDACDWTATTILGDDAEPAAHDVVRVPDGRVLIAQGPLGLPNAVRLADAATTYPALLGPIAKTLLDSIRAAPSDPMRLYVAQWGPTDGTLPRITRIQRSDDGGGSWAPFEVPLAGTEREMSVLGVDPADPDRLIVRMRNPAGDERVLFSDAGGAGGSWREVLTLRYVDVGLWGSDGAYVGGALDGLWHSPDGSTWTQVRESLTPHCLVQHGDELWACANDWIDGFAIGRSVDGGRTFEPVLRLAEIREPLACAAGTSAGDACPDEMFVLEEVWAVAPPLDADAGVPMPDAGLDGSVGDGGGLDAGVVLDARAPGLDGGRRPRRDSGHRDPPEVWAARGGGCSCGVSVSRKISTSSVMFLLIAAGIRNLRSRRGRFRRRLRHLTDDGVL